MRGGAALSGSRSFDSTMVKPNSMPMVASRKASLADWSTAALQVESRRRDEPTQVRSASGVAAVRDTAGLDDHGQGVRPVGLIIGGGARMADHLAYERCLDKRRTRPTASTPSKVRQQNIASRQRRTL